MMHTIVRIFAVFVVIGTLVACTTVGSGSANTRSYTLFWTLQREPAEGVRIAIDVPASWDAKLDPMGGPSFLHSGISYGPDIVLMPSQGTDKKSKIQALIQDEYEGYILENAPAETAKDGSVWIYAERSDGFAEARRLIAAPGKGGVVVCVVGLKADEKGQYEKLKRILSTVRIVTDTK